MDKNTIKSMDPNILVSMINMKLRDFYSSLDTFCEDTQVDIKELEEKLKSAGFVYIKEINQFK